MNDPPPLSSKEASFQINRQKQVGWFDTRNLLATGSQALAAAVVGSMSGRREIMAALEPETCKSFDYHGEEELWIDFVADTGDGWNATTSVAWLIGRDGLVIDKNGAPTPQPIPDHCTVEGMPTATADQYLLPAGKLLILGGDEVYPSASSEAYQQRFIDPFRCARWHDERRRHVFSIPGNHDWYDGLTSFIRLFCQSEQSRRWFGAWQAQQRRSYYAVKLPHNWWIWGLDMALEDDLDPPQYDYFRAQARNLQSGDRLILSVPTPTWIKRSRPGAKSDDDRFLGRDKLDLIMKLPKDEGRDVHIPLVLTGDLHYYARHRAELANGTRDYITWGGGGAFGLGTVEVPLAVDVAGKDCPNHTATLKRAFPDAAESVKLRRGALRFPFLNPAFTAALTALQAITLWLLSSAEPGWLDQLIYPELSFAELCALMAEALGRAATSPGLAIWLLILVAGFGIYAARGKPPVPRWLAFLAGVVHGFLQIVGAFLCVWLTAQAIGHIFSGTGTPLKDVVGDNYATLAFAAVTSYFYCGFLFGLYLFLAHKLLRGLHDMEVFSSQAIEDYKGFLRMKVSAKGLEIFPIGLRRHASHWQAAPGASLGKADAKVFGKVQSVTVPPRALRVIDPCEPLAPELLEGPIVIPGASAP